MLTVPLIRKYKKLPEDSYRRECPVCQKKVDPDSEYTEYVKTKRGSDIFFHRGCVKEWGKE